MTTKKEFHLNFTREEISHCEYTMVITEADADHIKDMSKDEIASWMCDREVQGDLYDWMQGKEYCEGEGERGCFSFSIDEYELTPLPPPPIAFTPPERFSHKRIAQSDIGRK